ncbi:MAG TPA: CbiQ family ECF transporter T component [Actinotalea sp.]|nr:CbiQ family ECF transporter T component [Actinotalea sp.]
MNAADVSLLGAYVPGRSWLHRARTEAKLGGLLLFGLVLALVPGRVGWVAGSLALAVVVGVALSARLPLGVAIRALRAVLVLGLTVAAYQWWRSGWEVALGVLTTLLALVLAGLVVTMTTPMDATVDVVERAARPLRRFGLKPEWVGLAVALTLRGVPALVQIAAEAREAARARGLERDPRAILVPTVVRTVARARTTGEALAARGLAD